MLLCAFLPACWCRPHFVEETETKLNTTVLASRQKNKQPNKNYSQTKPDAMEMRFLRGDCFVRQLSNCRTMPIPRTRNYAYENNDTGTAEVHLTRLISKPQNQSMRAETSLFLLFTLSQDHTEGRPAFFVSSPTCYHAVWTAARFQAGQLDKHDRMQQVSELERHCLSILNSENLEILTLNPKPCVSELD